MHTTTNEQKALQKSASHLGYMIKYVVKALHQEVWQYAKASTKDGVAAFAHAGQVLQLIFQTEFIQGEGGAHVLAHSFDAEGTVELSSAVADTDHHGVTASTKLAIGCSVDRSQYFLIVGAWVCAFNELGLHSNLSSEEIALLRNAAIEAANSIQGD